MPQLDKFLSALVSHGASALHLAADDVAKLDIANVARPVTKQALTASQLLTLLREVAPADAMRQLESGQPATFSYAGAGGSFVGRAATDGGKLRVACAPTNGTANGANGAAARPSGAQAVQRPSGAHVQPNIANANGNGHGMTPAHGMAGANGAARPAVVVAVVDEVARGEIEVLLRKLV